MEHKPDSSPSEQKRNRSIPRTLDLRARLRLAKGNHRFRRLPHNPITHPGSLPLDLADWLRRKTDDQSPGSGSLSGADDKDWRRPPNASDNR
jgi:hypothetical protein